MATIPERVLERVRRVATTWGTWWPVPGPYTSIILSDTDASVWSVPVSARTALAVDAVYGCLGIYADSISTLPVVRLRGDYEVLEPPPFVARPAGHVVGWTDEIGQILWSLLLRGNAYARVTSYDWTGYPQTFQVLNPDAVTIEEAPSGGPRYRWKPNGLDELVLDNPRPTDLLHLKWQVPPGSFCGLGVLDANYGPGSTLAGAYASQTYGADLMANPVPPAVLTHPGRLSKLQSEELQEQWSTSTARARAIPAVLSGGITYQPLTVTPRDVELIESQKWSATRIATVFRVPPNMVGGTTGDSLTYSTVEGEMSRLWIQSLHPMAVRLERAFSSWLPTGQTLRFKEDALLRPQTLDRVNAYDVQIRSGVLTVDEARALEHRAPSSTPAPAPLALLPAPPDLEEEAQ